MGKVRLLMNQLKVITNGGIKEKLKEVKKITSLSKHHQDKLNKDSFDIPISSKADSKNSYYASKPNSARVAPTKTKNIEQMVSATNKVKGIYEDELNALKFKLFSVFNNYKGNL